MKAEQFESIIMKRTSDRVAVSRERRKGYANEGDCLANFKLLAAVYYTLKLHGAEPRLDTPEGQCLFQILHKICRRANMMAKGIDLAERRQDTDLDLLNYVDLMFACEEDHVIDPGAGDPGTPGV